jgi:antitoxin VapB
MYARFVYTEPMETHIETTAKVFKSGNSQAVRLPKHFRLDCSEVTIRKRGAELIIKPKIDYQTALREFFAARPSIDEDFMMSRPLNMLENLKNPFEND